VINSLTSSQLEHLLLIWLIKSGKIWTKKGLRLNFEWQNYTFNGVMYACSVHMYQCINELWVYNSSNFCPSLQLQQRFFQNIALKGYLKIGMNGYHCFNFTENFLTKCVDPKQPKHVKFSLWSIIETFPRGGAWLFRGGAKILRGGAKRSRGRCAPRHTSPQNLAMLRIDRDTTTWKIKKELRRFERRHIVGN
jgi:hypothetical protein